MHSQLSVTLKETLKLDPERPEYHRAIVGAYVRASKDLYSRRIEIIVIARSVRGLLFLLY